jgi:hypothetical protein
MTAEVEEQPVDDKGTGLTSGDDTGACVKGIANRPKEAFVENAVHERGKELALDDRGKDLWAKYHVAGRRELLQRVRSDALFAVAVVEDLLTSYLDDAGELVPLEEHEEVEQQV